MSEIPPGKFTEHHVRGIMSRFWILGAPDPEMSAIERLLANGCERVAYAMADGRRVHAGNAYDATLTEPIEADTIYEIECMISDRTLLRSARCVKIDHHRPGDPGFGRPPADFLPASSIGQVIAELERLACPDYSHARDYGQFALSDRVGWTVNTWYGHAGFLHEYVLAAADHCLAAAYRGECPGVDPDALMRWRAESRAAFQRRPVADVLADVERARDALRAAPTLRLDRTGLTAADLRGQNIPELPEAAARDGICFVASVRERDGRIKIVCQSGSPEQIDAFMRVWAPEHGLTGIYGDPARGFAGGYLAMTIWISAAVLVFLCWAIVVALLLDVVRLPIYDGLLLAVALLATVSVALLATVSSALIIRARRALTSSPP